MSTLHEEAKELTDLAFIYGEDGAFYTAAAKLRAAAMLYENRALATDPRYADCKFIHGGAVCECQRCWQLAENSR